jgi:hypothetical protein
MLERKSALLSNKEPKVVHRRVRHLPRAPCEDRSILRASHGRQPPALKNKDTKIPLIRREGVARDVW